MSLSSIGSTTFFNGASALEPPSGMPSTGSPSDLFSSVAQRSAPSISGKGQLLSGLQSLSQSDPAQAKQLLTDLIARLRSEASQGGPRSAHRAQLADKLQQVADSGDLSSLLQAPASQGSGTWSRGAAAYNQTMAVTRASM